MSLLIYYPVYILLLIMLGGAVCRRMGLKKSTHHLFYSIPVDFFAGYTVFFSLTRILTLAIPHIRMAYAFSFIVSVTIILLTGRKETGPLKKQLRFLYYYIPVNILVFIFIILEWSQADPDTSPYASFGSLHSGRYANLILSILSNGRIPIVPQNYAQSLMASVPLIFTGPLSFLSLSILLSVSISFIGFLVFGFFRQCGYRTLLAFLFTIVTLFSVSSFSLQFVLLIDSGWPLFLLCGYTDTIAGIATFFIITLFVREKINTDSKQAWNNKWLYVYLACNIMLWAASAVQNIYFLFVFLLIVWFPYRRNLFLILRNYKTPVLIVLTGLLLGVASGGMITPNRFRDKNTGIPGMQALDLDLHSTGRVKISPGIPIRTIPVFPIVYDSAKGITMFHNLSEAEQVPHSLAGKLYADYGRNILLLPVCILFLFYLLHRKQDIAKEKLYFLLPFTLAFLAAGLLIVFPFAISDYKWELSRFFIPGFFLYNLLLPVCLYQLSKKITTRFAVPVFTFFMGIFIIIPLLDTSLLIQKNLLFIHNSDILKFYLRVSDHYFQMAK